MTSPNGITAEIDLRKSCQVVRDQGDRATCLACATSDAHAMHHGCDPLSVEFLFFHAIQLATVGTIYDGITFDEAAAALMQQGQPLEQEWPYSTVPPSPWRPPAITNLWKGKLDHSAVDAIRAIEHLITQGMPVVLGITLSAAFLAPSLPEFKISAAGSGFGGHAVLVVGFGRDEVGEKFFLVRNSWGDTWANGGYAWLAANYLADKLIGFAPVVAHS